MSDRFTYELKVAVADTSSSCSCDCDPVIQRVIEGVVGLDGAAATGSVLLGTDTPEAIAFGDLTGAHVVLLKATGGKVRARLTSTDGSQQAVPVDDVLFLVSRSVPITAIDLTRVVGSSDTPRVTFVIAQKL